MATPDDIALDAALTAAPRGYIGQAALTSGSAAISTLADISGLSVTFTAVAGRRYIAVFDGDVAGTATDVTRLSITNAANTVLKSVEITLTTVAQPYSAHIETAVQTPSAGSVTYKIRGQRVTGSGTTLINATSTNPSFIRVLDIGV